MAKAVYWESENNKFQRSFKLFLIQYEHGSVSFETVTSFIAQIQEQ